VTEAVPMTHTLMPPNNLPAQLSSFIGRHAEIAEVRQLLDKQRLVTLTGAGGCGKTRLALEVAAGALPDFEQGVWLVDLASLRDPFLLPQTIASALGIRERMGRGLLDTVSEYLRPRTLLLVLDNCEHMIQPSAKIASELLRTCPSLKILSTSREPLAIDGEAVWSLAPLSVRTIVDGTKGSAGQSASELRSPSEAVQLFEARARAAAPSFRLTADNAALVEEICRRLDGIPLGIELAAARLRSLSLEQVAERLDDRFHLLTGGSRTAPARHQTLAATLDWSYALLTDVERLVLQRASVFAGGWTLEAAEIICSGGSVPQTEVMDVLAHLVDKSLVGARADASGAMRYILLETIRQYAHQQLVASGEAPSIERRHAQWFFEFARQAVQPGSKFPLVLAVAAVKRWETEHDNFRIALEWSLSDAGDRELGLRLASTLSQFWQMRGYLSEGRAWRDALLSNASQASADARAEAWSLAGHALIYANEIAAGADCFRRSLELYEQLSDEAGVAWQRAWLAWVSVAVGDNSEAVSLAQRATEVLRRTDDYVGAAVALEAWGEAEFLRNNLGAARQMFDESLALSRQLPNPFLVGRRLTRLGQVAREQGDEVQAEILIDEALEVSTKVGDSSGATMAMAALAGVGFAEGLASWAARLLGAVAQLQEEAGSALWFFDRLKFEADIEAARRDLGAQAFDAAWRQGQSMTAKQALEHARKRPDAPASRAALKKEFGGLTSREREVATWIAQGRSNHEIAEAMTVGIKTVETYVTRILGKLGLDSRVQIAIWAIEKGMAPPPADGSKAT
jgi:predicted ATPase/DNA-binding CsgD family transcriptional regulator